MIPTKPLVSDTEQPSAPALTVNKVTNKTVDLSWTESSDGETGSGVRIVKCFEISVKYGK